MRTGGGALEEAMENKSSISVGGLLHMRHVLTQDFLCEKDIETARHPFLHCRFTGQTSGVGFWTYMASIGWWQGLWNKH